jgi:GTP-binding protein
MRFIDETRIFVAGGAGGRGCVAFLREKFRPKGGPVGGDGGTGGSVILEATSRASTLLDLHFTRHYRAERGGLGGGNDKHGANGSHVVISVPMGTTVTDEETGAVLGDLIQEGDVLVVAEGGLGGKGNAHFKTSVRQAPEYAQSGLPGEDRWVRLELKLLADVGLVGFPNAGKSTLIRKVSRSRAKVAEYPFTTLVPNLGVVPIADDQSIVIADVPGLIEGASEGIGLGHQFLRHIERTKALVYLLDATGQPGPAEAYVTLRRELERYDESLIERPSFVCLNKVDLVDEEWVDLCQLELEEVGVSVVCSLSGLTGDGTKQLIRQIAEVLYPPESFGD